MGDFKVSVTIKNPDGEVHIFEGSQIIFSISDNGAGNSGVVGEFNPLQIGQAITELDRAIGKALVMAVLGGE